ncbi:MAG TPA: tryptophan-rich sensory protein [Treponema sp.]|nr:tryptophan-rich sensory protein [Treponema sp.]
MKSVKKVFLCAAAIAVPLALGMVSSLIARGAMEQFGNMRQPPLSPPGWLFPVAWTVLYVCMGLASFFLLTARCETDAAKAKRKAAVILYAVQLVLNFIWSPIFFNAQLYYPALAVLAAMWLCIVAIMVLARNMHAAAFWLLLPYLLWTSFAAYLNIGIAVLN